MSDPSLFKWRNFEADMILCTVRWSLSYALSYRDAECVASSPDIAQSPAVEYSSAYSGILLGGCSVNLTRVSGGISWRSPSA